jgi:hypothetical protein
VIKLRQEYEEKQAQRAALEIVISRTPVTLSEAGEITQNIKLRFKGQKKPRGGGFPGHKQEVNDGICFGRNPVMSASTCSDFQSPVILANRFVYPVWRSG